MDVFSVSFCISRDLVQFNLRRIQTECFQTSCRKRVFQDISDLQSSLSKKPSSTQPGGSEFIECPPKKQKHLDADASEVDDSVQSSEEKKVKLLLLLGEPRSQSGGTAPSTTISPCDDLTITRSTSSLLDPLNGEEGKPLLSSCAGFQQGSQGSCSPTQSDSAASESTLCSESENPLGLLNNKRVAMTEVQALINRYYGSQTRSRSIEVLSRSPLQQQILLIAICQAWRRKTATCSAAAESKKKINESNESAQGSQTKMQENEAENRMVQGIELQVRKIEGDADGCESVTDNIVAAFA